MSEVCADPKRGGFSRDVRAYILYNNNRVLPASPHEKGTRMTIFCRHSRREAREPLLHGDFWAGGRPPRGGVD